MNGVIEYQTRTLKNGKNCDKRSNPNTTLIQQNKHRIANCLKSIKGYYLIRAELQFVSRQAMRES